MEIEDTLENNLNVNELISEQILNQLKGHLFRIINSQNGSRILQKCLIKTPKETLSKMFNEVSIFIFY